MAATTHTGSQLARLVREASALIALDANFRKGTWTFKLPPEPVQAGYYFVLDVMKARDALLADEQRPQGVVLPPPSGQLKLRWWEDSPCDQGYGSWGLTARRAGLDVNVWKDTERTTWRVREDRLDEQGRNWGRYWNAVTDDFGDLVEVQ